MRKFKKKLQANKREKKHKMVEGGENDTTCRILYVG